MTIANVDAVPLYLHCLRRAAPELQLRGLQIWRKLLQSNMANLSAADRYSPSCTSLCVKQAQVLCWADKRIPSLLFRRLTSSRL